MWLYHRVIDPNDVDGMANSVDPDQTAPRSSLIWVCTVCPGISVRKLRIVNVMMILQVQRLTAKCYSSQSSLERTYSILVKHVKTCDESMFCGIL